MKEVSDIDHNAIIYAAVAVILIMFLIICSRNKEIKSLNASKKALIIELNSVKKELNSKSVALIKLKEQYITLESDPLNWQSARYGSRQQAMAEKLCNTQKEIDSKNDELVKLQKQYDKLKRKSYTILENKVADAIDNLVEKSPFSYTPVFKAISAETVIYDKRFINAFEDDTMMLTSTPEVSAKVLGQNGVVYDVTLSNCTCRDFQIRQRPCKHMYRLAIHIGALAVADSEAIKKGITEYREKCNEAAESLKQLNNERMQAQREAERTAISLKKEREKTLTTIRKHNARFLSKLNSQGYNSAWIAKMYGDYYDMFIGNLINDLENKVKPAHAVASRIEKNCRAEMRNLAARAKHSEDLVLLYESFYPNLPALCDMTADDIPPSLDESLALEPKTEYESMRKWISRSEYDLLPRVEKYQLALDNYKHRNRSNWAAGIDFERYICYLYELKGYRVVCFGALNGVADLGRDLYAFKDSEVIIIQCKRWSAQKLIHEKHVYQLFGTVTDYCIENPLFNTHGLLIATCNLSDKAREVAGRIGIEFEENVSFPEYPMVKCNINRATGEKIYHLPFDQQYDKVQIEYDKGEFYAWTVSEAERKGFRRAFRHIINSAAEH